MNRKILFLFLFFASFVSYGQVAIDYRNCSVEQLRQYQAAPCDISGNGKVAALYMIQVGAYRNLINPKPGIIAVPSTLYDSSTQTNETMYRYFYAAIFDSEENAKQYMASSNLKATYCDAIVVQFPFVGVIGFN